MGILGRQRITSFGSAHKKELALVAPYRLTRFFVSVFIIKLCAKINDQRLRGFGHMVTRTYCI